MWDFKKSNNPTAPATTYSQATLRFTAALDNTQVISSLPCSRQQSCKKHQSLRRHDHSQAAGNPVQESDLAVLHTVAPEELQNSASGNQEWDPCREGVRQNDRVHGRSVKLGKIRSTICRAKEAPCTRECNHQQRERWLSDRGVSRYEEQLVRLAKARSHVRKTTARRRSSCLLVFAQDVEDSRSRRSSPNIFASRRHDLTAPGAVKRMLGRTRRRSIADSGAVPCILVYPSDCDLWSAQTMLSLAGDDDAWRTFWLILAPARSVTNVAPKCWLSAFR